MCINLLLLVKEKRGGGGIFSCIGQMKMIHVVRQATPRLDDTTDLNSGSVQYHSVKQDIIAISYLRKF